MSGGEILFIAHRIPFPPDRGDKIRSHHVLKALARLAPMHVATFADDEADAAAEADLATVAASYRLIQRRKPVLRAGLEAVASGRPVSLTAFHDPLLAEYISETIRSRNIAAIYVFSGQMGQYVPADFAGRVILDFVDADSAKFAAYAKSGHLPSRWVNRREARLLRSEEARLVRRAHASLLISDEEAALFASRLTETERSGARIAVLRNGIDLAQFDPFATAPQAELASIPAPRLIFSGQMDYAPNITAALRAARRIMPKVRAAFPDATLHIVGRKPTAQVLALDGLNGCKVWGRVDDMPAWLRAADLALVPLEIARGVQNKVLEAMAMALPVVASVGAATGIGAEPGREIAVGESDEQIASHAIALLRDRQRALTMGLAARRYVERQRNWDAVLAGLPELIGPLGPQVRDVA
ncbi:MAG: TIGR03087 family PEP-CTERM/XrtA system glycosyltransferase [Novosphingobium sp.]